MTKTITIKAAATRLHLYTDAYINAYFTEKKLCQTEKYQSLTKQLTNYCKRNARTLLNKPVLDLLLRLQTSASEQASKVMIQNS